MSKPYLAIAAIVRDEAPYIAEWLAFHEVVGVEHFFIYENGSIDGTRELLAGRDNVTLFDWPGDYQQFNAFHNALVRCTAHWLAFIDVDEFLFSPTYQPVSTILRSFESDDAVAACWATFGTSGHRLQPTGGVLRSYTRRARADAGINHHVKSIVQPGHVEHAPLATPHSFACHTVDTLRRPVHGPFAQSVTWNLLQLNHYWTKSEEECASRSARARSDAALARRLSDPFTHEPLDLDYLNAEEDRTVQPYVALVESREAR